MLISSGEFARICNISRELLIHYDRIDLLKPEEVGENGYRYYSMEQLYFYEVIRFFMDAGMSTKEIKDYLDHRTTQLFLSSIQDRIDNLQQQRDVLDARIGMMDKMRYLTQHMLIFPKGEPRLSYWDELCFITTDIGEVHTKQDYAHALSNHSQFCRSAAGVAMFPIGRVVEIPDPTRPEDYRHTKLVTWTNRQNTLRGLDERISRKPKGAYAVILHQGGISTVGTSYAKLLSYIKREGFSMLGPLYEIDVNSYLMSESAQDYLLHISVLVDASGGHT